jgi:HEPN domain-containing protein
MTSEVHQWLVKALEDYHVAQHEMLLPETDVVTTAVCFHCQQFVEKVLKAFLVLHQRDFPRTHDLGYLKSLCAQIDADFAALAIEELSFYAVEFRYPGVYVRPTLDEAKRCMSIAETVRRFVEEKLGVSIDHLSNDSRR